MRRYHGLPPGRHLPFSSHRPFQWSPLPGITISSRYRWKLSTVLIFAALGALLLWLWWSTPTQHKSLRSPPAPHKSVAIPHVPRGPSQARQDKPHYPPSLRRRPPTAHPPRFIPSKQRRRRLTPKQRQLVLQKYGHRCADCRRVLEVWDTEMDHDIPLAADPYGRHTAAMNHISRFVPRCRRCHGYRTWMQRRAGLFRRPTPRK